jgi:polar amino acid transport system substrate-binding protein
MLKILTYVRFVLVLLPVLWFSAQAKSETLTFASTEFPPYIIKQGDEITGYQVELVRELCRRLGCEAHFTIVPWARALEYVKVGQADGILSPVWSKDRAEYIYFTDEPVGHERISIMSLKGAGIKARSLDDLKDELIGVISSYRYGKDFDDNKTVQKIASYTNDSLLKKLDIGRYRVIASDEYVINYVAKLSGHAELETILNLRDSPQYLGFSKASNAHGQELAKRFSQAIHDMQQDGTMEKLRKKYF